MGRLCDPATMIAAVMIAFLSGSGGAVAYDKQSGPPTYSITQRADNTQRTEGFPRESAGTALTSSALPGSERRRMFTLKASTSIAPKVCWTT
jgi:hypothetical protein